MNDWIASLAGHLGRGETTVVVTVAATAGSTPRAPGTRMLVTADALDGTVGGGAVELRATRVARDMLDGGPAMVRRDVAGTSDLGQACGGRLTLVFDRVAPPGATWLDAATQALAADDRPVVISRLDDGARLVITATGRDGGLGGAGLDEAAAAAARRDDRTTRIETHDEIALLIDPVRADQSIDVAVFGAGHVGKAIVAVLGIHPDVRITWVDDRAELFPDQVVAGVRVVPTDDPPSQADALPAGAYVVVASHGHGLDYAIVERVLRRGDFRYCGLIGSAPKRARFEKRWRERGLPEDTLARLVCPIGVPGITGRHPADIAVAVAAEILQVRDSEKAETIAAEA